MNQPLKTEHVSASVGAGTEPNRGFCLMILCAAAHRVVVDNDYDQLSGTLFIDQLSQLRTLKKVYALIYLLHTQVDMPSL